jgi:protein-S-isoprenylcysteine O-methyltransferase Ste14
MHSELLVADGPYRHVRNPLYLGNVLQAFGIGLMASRLGFAFLTIANTIFMIRLILREEAGLLQWAKATAATSRRSRVSFHLSLRAFRAAGRS